MNDDCSNVTNVRELVTLLLWLLCYCRVWGKIRGCGQIVFYHLEYVPFSVTIHVVVVANEELSLIMGFGGQGYKAIYVCTRTIMNRIFATSIPSISTNTLFSHDMTTFILI